MIFRIPFGSLEFLGLDVTCSWWVNTFGGVSGDSWPLRSVTTIEVTKREPQREMTGSIAGTTPTHHRRSYPVGGASKVIVAAAIKFFRPARSANNHETRANEQKNGGYARDLDSCIAAAVPHVALEGSPSAHPRHPES